MASVSFVGLNPVQRQSLVISLTAFFTALLLIALVSVLILITYRGTAYFWPEPIYQITVSNDQETRSVLANMYEDASSNELILKYADAQQPYGSQMRVQRNELSEVVLALNSAEIKLQDGRRILAIPQHIITPEYSLLALDKFDDVAQEVAVITDQIETINTQQLAPIHEALSQFDKRDVDDDAPAREKLVATFSYYQNEVLGYEARRDQFQLHVVFADGKPFTLPLSSIQDVDFVSRLTTFEKWKVAFSEIGVFLTDSPKQANTSGGVFPALFGTVLMVFLMTIIVTPFGVLAAIYLSEYAPHNAMTTIIRVSVSNMAGVPSIVYGVLNTLHTHRRFYIYHQFALKNAMPKARLANLACLQCFFPFHESCT